MEAFISKDLIEELNRLFPNKVPSLTFTDREVWYKAGARSVVDYLESQHALQQSQPITKTVLNVQRSQNPRSAETSAASGPSGSQPSW